MRAQAKWAWAVLLATASPALAQDEDPGSPRATVQRFLEHARAGREREAAATFGPLRDGADPLKLVHPLRSVLERLPLDLATVSDRPEGRRDDGLPADLEEVATVQGADGPEPVRLMRTGGRWVFAPSTLGRVPGWYEALPHRFLLEHTPRTLLKAGPRELAWWQWLALPVLLLLALAGGRLLAWPLGKLLGALARRTRGTFDDEVLAHTKGPLVLAIATLVAWFLLPVLDARPAGRRFLDTLLQSALLVAFFWAVLRLVDVGLERVRASAFVQARPGSAALLPLTSKVAKVAVVVLAGITVLQRLGFPAASLLAGLGIGGLAVALAAQKTVENLFGSVTLGIDQPFRPGDFVKVDDLVGTVETVGLRSTRIRTLDRTLVTLPNGRLADTRIETFAARDRIRFAVDLQVRHDTSAAQLRAIVEGVRALLLARPEILPGEVSVFFKGFAPGSLVVEVVAAFQTADWKAFLAIRQEVLFAIMETVERNGSGLAVPVTSVQLGGRGGEKTQL